MANKKFVDLPALTTMSDTIIVPVSDGTTTKKITGANLKTYFLNGPAFSAYAAAVLQTITSGSQQKVLFQVEEFDTNNNYANSRFTPTVAGYYQLNAEVRLDGASGTGEMMIVIWKNGAEYRRGTNQQGTQIATNFWAMQVSSVVYANGTDDYFEIYVQQGSGGNLTVTAVNVPYITWFNGCMMRGA
jgi:aspartate aminotransferase-like enzyme